MAQFHFDPDTYLAMIRAEVPDYDELQARVASALSGLGDRPRVLDLGAGTGATTLAVLRVSPDARVVLLDESEAMLAVARAAVPRDRVEAVIVADLAGDLPAGPFDAVVSTLAIHHLDAAAKRALFAQIRDRLRDGGRFVMADVVVPDGPADAVTPLTPEYDLPDRPDELLAWLRAAGFAAECTWRHHDLALFQGRL